MFANNLHFFWQKLGNTEIRKIANIETVETMIQLRRLRWLGHVERIPETRRTQCKKNSSTGIYGISTELLLLGADETVKWLKLIADQIWVEEKVPSDWTKQITVPIFKKGSRLKCDNFRGISLLCSAYKVFARAMLNRMKHYVEEQLSKSQFGFRAKRGCCDQLFSTKILMQRAKEFNVPVYLCFIDLCEAYDSVKRNLLWAVLRRVYNFPEKFVSIIEALHKETYGVVRFEGRLSEEYKVESGVK